MENALSCVLAPSICSKWYRGSEEMITGTQPRGLRNRLYLVVLFGEELSASIQPGNESVDMIFIDELAHFHPVVLFADTERCERASAGQSAVDHHSREFFETHSLEQVRSSDVRRQPPVFVGIEFSVSVEILERKSIHR